MLFRKIAAAGLAASLLAGCASDPTAGQKATLGTLAGAVGGAAIGSAFGAGSGKVAAIAAGALIGGFLGNQIGKSMDEADQQYYAAAQYQAFESGSPAQWQNPQSGKYGDIRPGASYQVNQQFCREYTSTVYIDGQPQVARGTACRQPDGTWRPVG